MPNVPTCPMCHTCPRALRALPALRALRAQAPYMPYVHTCPNIFYRPENQKNKNIDFNEIKWRFVHWCFQGCWRQVIVKTCLRKIHSKKIFSNERLTNRKKKKWKRFVSILYSVHMLVYGYWRTFKLILLVQKVSLS